MSLILCQHEWVRWSSSCLVSNKLPFYLVNLHDTFCCVAVDNHRQRSAGKPDMLASFAFACALVDSFPCFEIQCQLMSSTYYSVAILSIFWISAADCRQLAMLNLDESLNTIQSILHYILYLRRGDNAVIPVNSQPSLLLSQFTYY